MDVDARKEVLVVEIGDELGAGGQPDLLTRWGGAPPLLNRRWPQIVAVTADVGAAVGVGDPLVTLEAMKMEHAVRAPAVGVVAEVRVAVGDQVEAGDVLVVLEVEA